MADTTNASIQNRPYRSHRVPACTRCRSRKIRCHIDIPNQPCLSCRERRLKCQYMETRSNGNIADDRVDRRPSKRPRLSTSDQSSDNPARSHSARALPKVTMPSSEQSSIMVGPAVAEDVDILQRHISEHRPGHSEPSDPYQLLSHDAGNPIIYLSVPRCRIGLQPAIDAGKGQLEIVEQILGPFKDEVIGLYFNFLHFHFPILDDETCSVLRRREYDRIPQPLRCVIYANAIPMWGKSDTLKLHPRPDSHYIWNKAISALLDDFISPSLATVSCAVLDQIGRPSVSIVGNITLSGRTVALAQIFGLHRDPTKWNIQSEEKSTRIRLWWGVLLNDYWASIAYDTPPHVAKGFYDVQIPSLDSILPARATSSQRYASTCFVHLCALTELLGDILPLVYHIKPRPDELSHAVERLQAELQNLESQLPEWLPLPARTGTSNLWFCFLSMRLLLSRLALRAAVLMGNTAGAGSHNDRLDDLRASSSAVLDFVLFLRESQFQDFWLPYAAHLLVLAVMVSLRCTVEAQSTDIRSASISRLERLIAHIQFASDNYDWDIANYCLERISGPVSKIASLAARESQPPPEPAVLSVTENGGGGSMSVFDEPLFLLSDLLDTTAFDFSWEALWDTPAGMSNFTI
ncbi:C6 transcription factor-like protein [Zopfia rhizophila CBS 207.26]|uniref:C6 transcription factor-like protein n=1 Tax=Zopfia rhizophila CBS 207.26 TaxID=1314779 RepID=A0A6A6EVL5_9PEZI|nr:C6 transcription factor-like protein [Zopfia rhizophila CBS 207.26]